MTSHTEKGRRFREACKVALEQVLGCRFESEISISGRGLKPHKFDLVTPQRHIIAECKAFGWTSGGNVPSAKMTHLREAVDYLCRVPGVVTLYLIIKADPHPKKGETLGAYFVRLNKDILGPVNVLELPEHGGTLVCLHGRLEAGTRDTDAAETGAAEVHRTVDAGELGAIRRQLFQILDWREGRHNREEGPGKRISDLVSKRRIPPHIASLMQTILRFRNVVEYEEYSPSEAEATVIRNALKAIMDWAQGAGYKSLR